VASSACSQRISGETLSAWRSRLLDPGEAERIAAHVDSCPACQAHLATFDRIARELRSQRLPISGDALWRRVAGAISQRERNPMSRTNKAVALTGLGAMAIVVILFAALLLTRSPGQSGSTPIANATNTPTATATRSPTATPVPERWQTLTSIDYGKGLAFASNTPQTGYICGNTDHQGGGDVPLQLGVSHDGGRTWLPATALPISGDDCIIFVNPTDASDLVIRSFHCWEGCGDEAGIPYRSVDGGKTWAQLVLPPGNESSGLTDAGPVNWIGSTLFTYAIPPGTQGGQPAPKHEVAYSVNNGPLTWAATNPFPLSGYPYNVSDSFSLGNKFCLLGNSNNELSCTQDDGTNWQATTASGVAPFYVVPSPDGKTLFGYSYLDNIVSSSADGGQTWAELPSIPGGSNAASIVSMAAAPDNTIYALNYPGSGPTVAGVYKLAPGGGSWSLAASYPAEQYTALDPLAVTWNNSGHPQTLWAVGINGPNPGGFIPIIQEHGP
jgi:hypothetical protein